MLGIAVREYNMCKGIKCFIVVVGSQTINVFVGARRWRHVSIWLRLQRWQNGERVGLMIFGLHKFPM